jgi:hypothetical protein
LKSDYGVDIILLKTIRFSFVLKRGIMLYQ